MFMIVMVYFSRVKPTIDPISITIKRACTIIGVIAMVVLVLCILSYTIIIVT